MIEWFYKLEPSNFKRTEERAYMSTLYRNDCRHKGLLAAAFAFAGVALIGPVDAKAEVSVPQMEISVVIEEDGSALVTQNWQTYTDEGTEFYLYYKDSGYLEYTDFTVRDETQAYEDLGEWDVYADFEDKAYCSGINFVDDGVELCWGISEYGSNSYTISYRLWNLVTQYEDQPGFLYRFVNSSDQFYPTQVTMTIEMADGTPLAEDDARIWGFGYDGQIVFEDGKVIVRTESDLCDDENITVLLALDDVAIEPEHESDLLLSDVIDTALEDSDYLEEYLDGDSYEDDYWDFIDYYDEDTGIGLDFENGDVYAVVVRNDEYFYYPVEWDEDQQAYGFWDEDFEWCYVADEPYWEDLDFDCDIYETDWSISGWEDDSPDGFLDSLLWNFDPELLLFVIIAGGIAIYVGLQVKRNSENTARIADAWSQAPVYMEIPNGGNLNVTYALAKMAAMADKEAVFSARIMKLALEGAVDLVESPDHEGRQNLKLNPAFESGDYCDMRLFYTLRKAAGDNQLLSEKELKRYVEKHWEKLDDYLTECEKAGLTTLEESGCIKEGGSKALDLTDAGMEALKEVIGFKKYLENYEAYETSQPAPSQEEWISYLPYAALFGIIEDFEVHVKKAYGQEEYQRNYYPYFWYGHYCHRYSHAMEIAVRNGRAAHEASMNASHSNFSGGGGSSSIGGGGGFSGGGGGGVR